MKYILVEIDQYRPREWVAYVRETRTTKTATSRAELEAAVREHLYELYFDRPLWVEWLG